MMETREFAERVLFATTLEEKLRAPEGGLTDANPGKAILTPECPGRPDALVMRREGVKIEAPGAQGLESDEDRGTLMHFLANHELLATELMALVLLKFPDAPTAFRRGVVRTLQEEQEHTRMYLRRMNECGVAFGSIPVNGFFWKAVATMETPLDYVTRLSLTFEQANLDFSKYYGALFKKAGDEETGELMEQIYRDEIAHVGYGLKWFRRWKGREEDDFSAYEKQLPYPLSPARAKGDHMSDLRFNEEGRLKAGLDEEFVRKLRLYRRSKGRTPRVYCYNPQAEAEAAHCVLGEGRVFVEEPAMTGTRRDLGMLPLALARKDDVVVVEQKPSDWLLEHWAACGIEVPEFVVGTEGLLERKLDRLMPWAWGQSAFQMKEALGERWAPNAVHPLAWSRSFAELFGKGFGLELREAAGVSAGFVCRTVSQVVEAVRKVGNGVVKPGFGLAGRRMLRVGGEVDAAVIAAILGDHEHVVVEPWRERLMDFSVQFEMGEDGLVEVGKTRLENDERGRFRASHVASQWSKGGQPEVLRWLHETDATAVYRSRIQPLLEKRLREVGFVGAVGVDAYIYRGVDGQLRLEPVCEVNPRMTMGRVALGMRSKVSPGRSGRLQVWTKRTLKENGWASFQAMIDQLPAPQLDERGFLQRGTVVLNDPKEVRMALAVFEVF